MTEITRQPFRAQDIAEMGVQEAQSDWLTDLEPIDLHNIELSGMATTWRVDGEIACISGICDRGQEEWGRFVFLVLAERAKSRPILLVKETMKELERIMEENDMLWTETCSALEEMWVNALGFEYLTSGHSVGKPVKFWGYH